MHTAVRPVITSGLALVGASVIAVTPLAAPPTGIKIANPLVELSALVNPIDVFTPIFETAAENAQALAAEITANPAPILQQIVNNQIASATTLGNVAQTFIQNEVIIFTGTDSGTIPGNLQQAFAAIQAGDFSTAAELFSIIPLLPLLGNGLANLELLPDIIGVLQKPLANAQAVLQVLANPFTLLPIGFGALTLLTGPAQAFGGLIEDLVAAVSADNPLEAAFNAFVNRTAEATSAIFTGLLDPNVGILPGLQGLRETIADAITPAEATSTVASSSAATTHVVTLNATPAPERTSTQDDATVNEGTPPPKASDTAEKVTGVIKTGTPGPDLGKQVAEAARPEQAPQPPASPSNGATDLSAGNKVTPKSSNASDTKAGSAFGNRISDGLSKFGIINTDKNAKSNGTGSGANAGSTGSGSSSGTGSGSGGGGNGAG